MFGLDPRGIPENMSLSSNESLKWYLCYYLFTFPFKVEKCLKEKFMTRLLVVIAAHINTQTNLLNHKKNSLHLTPREFKVFLTRILNKLPEHLINLCTPAFIQKFFPKLPVPSVTSGYSTIITKQTEKDDGREPLIAS